LLIAYDDEQPTTGTSSSQIVAATVLKDRIHQDKIGLSHCSQHIGQVRSKLRMIPEDLVSPQSGGHDNSRPIRVPSLSSEIRCHQSQRFRKTGTLQTFNGSLREGEWQWVF
jgi:hypothetical protein